MSNNLKLSKKEDMNEIISIIIPVYKVENYLNKCVESVVNQTYKNLEIILVDDGSPDNCPKMCDDWAKKDKRIKVVHKPNGGLSDARNAGINISKGKYICFADSDDYLVDKFVEILYNNLVKTDSDLSICSFCYVYENVQSFPNPANNLTIYEGEEVIDALFKKNNVDHMVAWSKLYKRELFNNLRFDVGKLHEDEFIAHKIFVQCKKVVYTTAQLYCYLQRKGSLTQNKSFTEKNLDGAVAIENRVKYFLDTKWKEKSITQFLAYLSYLYYIAKTRHASKDILKFIRNKYKEYYKKIKHKNLSKKLFYYFPKLFCLVRKLKEKYG